MLKRVYAPVYVWVPGPHEPVDPGWGLTPPLDPGFGVRPPVDPGYGRPDWGPVDPGFGNRPPTDPGYGRPDIGAGHPGNKPPGRPILPPRPDNKPPNGGRPPHPWLPGRWEPVDPGYGKPPLWGWIPGPDNGLPAPPARPDNSLPGGGTWVPTDPDYGKPVYPCPPCPGGKPHPPIWAWIPDLPDLRPDNTLPEGGGEGQAKITLYPTEGTAPAAGGSGSINVTLAAPGTWQVGSTPEWLTVSPQGPQTADQNVLYTAAANDSGATRQATIAVNDATFTLKQSA